MDREPREPPPGEDAEACPRCGTPHDAYQEYCLECGARLPRSYALAPRGWGGESSPTWLWAGLVALLLVALVAGAIVAVAATDDEESGATSGTLGTGTNDLGIVTGIETLTVPPDGEVAPPGDDGGPASGEWPAGTDGFTIVLASVPIDAGRGQARRIAREAREAGLPDVGILSSNDYSSLRPGYFVVFSGIYTTIGEAQAALENARAFGFPVAYVREIAA